MNARPPAAAVVWMPHPRRTTPQVLSSELENFRTQLQDLPRTADPAVLLRILETENEEEVALIRRSAEETLLTHCGDTVRLRGLIEFSNRCVCDCHYCGIRRGNRRVERYSLSLDDIVQTALWCAQKGYGSVVLQAGERRDEPFVAFVEDAVRRIKAATRTNAMPEGVGITLCVGEQSDETYRRWYEAGGHRYLLRMETFSPRLFAALHPPTQTYDNRLTCLDSLKRIGYQVGTGVMIGLPGQSAEDLVADLLAFRDLDVDMLGMGPYIPHADAVLPGNPSVADAAVRMRQALRMIAAARLLIPDINIAATTALQTLEEDGREQGLRFGANVIMPQVTPPQVRRMYTLYDGKPCLDDDPEQCAHCIEGRIHSVGRRVLRHAWGDSLRYRNRIRHID